MSTDGERRGEAGDEVDAGLDHRRRVQVRADRRRRHHRRRQPRVERHLRRLGEGAEQDQHEGDGHRRAVGRVGEDGAEPVRACLLAEDDQPGEHGQRAGAGHQQRLEGGGAGLRLGVVVADEQERGDRRQLPEPVEHEHVVGEDEPGHRPGEQHEQAEQADVARRRVVEVAGRVGEHEDADAGDEHQHQGGEAVEAQGEVDAELGDPLDGLGQHVAVDDVGQADGEPHHRGQRRAGRRRGTAGGDRPAISSLPSGRRRRPGGGRAAGPSSRRTLGAPAHRRASAGGDDASNAGAGISTAVKAERPTPDVAACGGRSRTGVTDDAPHRVPAIAVTNANTSAKQPLTMSDDQAHDHHLAWLIDRVGWRRSSQRVTPTGGFRPRERAA